MVSATAALNDRKATLPYFAGICQPKFWGRALREALGPRTSAGKCLRNTVAWLSGRLARLSRRPFRDKERNRMATLIADNVRKVFPPKFGGQSPVTAIDNITFEMK